MKEKYNLDGIRYEEHGNGDNVIVLIHGFLSSSSYWAKVRPGLVNAGYRVISIDLLGFGDAAKPRSIDYSYMDQIEYIDRIINSLKLSKSFNLIGHSMGALIAARYVALYPNKIKSLVLLHPPLYMNATEANETLMNTNIFYRHLLGSKYRNIAWRVIRASVPGIIANHTHDAREKSLRNIIIRAELFTDLEKIKTDTILLVGLKDRPIYLYNLSKVSLNSSIKIIQENVDHHSPIKQSHLVQRLILNFISKL